MKMALDSKTICQVLDSDVSYYKDWVIRMRLLLNAKDCLSIVENNLSDTSTPEQRRLDAKAHELIARHCDVYALRKIDGETTAVGAWNKLKDAYKDDTTMNQTYLLNKLLQIKMDSKEDIREYFFKFDTLVNELSTAGVDAMMLR